jgi:hypothetical protein
VLLVLLVMLIMTLPPRRPVPMRRVSVFIRRSKAPRRPRRQPES